MKSAIEMIDKMIAEKQSKHDVFVSDQKYFQEQMGLCIDENIEALAIQIDNLRVLRSRFLAEQESSDYSDMIAWIKANADKYKNEKVEFVKIVRGKYCLTLKEAKYAVEVHGGLKFSSYGD